MMYGFVVSHVDTVDETGRLWKKAFPGIPNIWWFPWGYPKMDDL